MTSQTRKQIITLQMHILSNISRSKDIQTVKFGHLIENNFTIFFIKNYAENEMETSSRPIFVYGITWGKCKWSTPADLELDME